MRIKILDRNGIDDLINAIVLQAASDYQNAYKRLRKGDDAALYRIDEIEKFFNSEWGDFLSHGMAKDILRRLQKEQETKEGVLKHESKNTIQDDLC